MTRSGPPPLQRSHRVVLATDALINTLLGILLVWLPSPMMAWLGLPAAGSRLYTTVLGGVLVGIGLALLLELGGGRGLGLGGAIAINLCGAGLLVVWLVARPEALGSGAAAVLWAIAAVVLLTSAVELAVIAQQARR